MSKSKPKLVAYTGNHVARDLRTPKYRMRVVPAYNQYIRARSKQDWQKDRDA